MGITRHWRLYASVDRVLVLHGQGPRSLLLADRNGWVTVVGLE